MSEHVVWTQWDDLNVPANFKKLSPTNTPAETGDLSEVTFYVPTYMGGYPALELSKKMPKLQVLQVPNAGYDDALEYLRPGITLCNGRGIHNDSTAELAVGLTIASLRGFVEFVRNQDQGEWVNRNHKSINDCKIGIVGSGMGGLGLAIRSAVAGHEVIVFEANPYVGGKLAQIEKDGFRFDAGPSLFTMPHLVDELFTLAGKNPRDYFLYERLPEICRYFWEDGTRLQTNAAPEETAAAIAASWEPGLAEFARLRAPHLLY